MDSIITAATEDTLRDLRRWARAIWAGEEPDLSKLDERLVKVMMAGAMGGVSTVKMDEMVGDVDRHFDGQTKRFVTDATGMMLTGWHRETPKPDVKPDNRLASGQIVTPRTTARTSQQRSVVVDRHAELTDAVFREMVSAIAKKRPTLGVLSPKELSERLRQTAFFVSGVLKSNVLERIRAKLLEARIKGKGQSWFTAEVNHLADLSRQHVETVFRTNVESAAGAARWKQLHDPDVEDLFFGYRYWNPSDEHSRPLHRAMHGFVALKEDPIWRLIWTPNGYSCRCKCRGLRRHQAVSVGLIDDRGRTLRQRVYASSLQERTVLAAESGGSVVVGRSTLQFPDDGFRGNALMDLI